MKCPNCKVGSMRVEVTFCGYVIVGPDPDSTEGFEVVNSEPGDSEWQDDSGVECLDCGWTGQVSNCE